MNDRKLRKTLEFLGTSYYIDSNSAAKATSVVKKEGLFRQSTGFSEKKLKKDFSGLLLTAENRNDRIKSVLKYSFHDQ